jgi:hypothetical protein
LYIDGNHKRKVASVRNKGKWLLFKASCLYVRQVAVTCRCGISVVRNLKFLTPFFIFLTIINIILSTNRSYVISPCNTNINIMVVINCLIKMQHIVPIDLINAILVAECFIKHIFKLYRLPNLIISNYRNLFVLDF